jgi:hypothetical protein
MRRPSSIKASFFPLTPTDLSDSVSLPNQPPASRASEKKEDSVSSVQVRLKVGLSLVCPDLVRLSPLPEQQHRVLEADFRSQIYNLRRDCTASSWQGSQISHHQSLPHFPTFLPSSLSLISVNSSACVRFGIELGVFISGVLAHLLSGGNSSNSDR